MAAYANFNNVLIGEKAAGMGGAFAAVVGDASANAFYNPATLSWMHGHSLSTTANLYMKNDVDYARPKGFSQSALRVNQGSIKPVPSSSGTVHTFGNFALGLSILTPDFSAYTGEIETSDSVTSFLNTRDESLWVGGSTSLNISESESLGLTMYYTSRTFSRSVSDISQGSTTYSITEDKELAHNSLVYILGYFKQINRRWSFGFSHRFRSLGISGKGSYTRSRVGTDNTVETTNKSDMNAQTTIPNKSTLGIAYKIPKFFTVSFDASFYDEASYDDLDDPTLAEKIEHRPVWNFHLGGEYHHRSWLAFRAGVFTNNSSTPDIPTTPTRRYQDHIDMLGFSFNAGFHTSENSSVSLGGYYTGGSGHAVEIAGQELAKIKKSAQAFTFLVSTAYNF
tara:strand:+ start:146600 stop:147784 length:1185 start_codon:yes stop_codon:yes gene_type:complete